MNMAAKPTPIIPTAIANPRDPYVACPTEAELLLAEGEPVALEAAEEPEDPDPVGDAEPEALSVPNLLV